MASISASAMSLTPGGERNRDPLTRTARRSNDTFTTGQLVARMQRKTQRFSRIARPPLSLRLAAPGACAVPPSDAARKPAAWAAFVDLRASPARLLAGLTGPLLLGLGQGISITAGFGAFGFSVLLDGLSTRFGMPLWLSQTVLTLMAYAIAWFWARIPLGAGTLPALLLIGPAIAFGAGFTPAVFSLLGNLVAFATGLTLFAFGISLAAAAAQGPDGITALSLAAEKRHGWPVPRATLLWNSIGIGAGLSLGGTAGAATLIGLFAVPVMVRVMLPRLRRLLGVRMPLPVTPRRQGSKPDQVPGLDPHPCTTGAGLRPYP